MDKYVFILPSDLIGGAEMNLQKLVRFLSEKGSLVYVIFLSCHKSLNESMWEDMNGVHYIFSPTKRESVGCIWLLWIILTNRNIFSLSFKYGITSHVHCNSLISILKKIRLININKLILRESTNVFSWFKGVKLSLIKILYRFYDNNACIICQTGKMKSELLSNIPKFNKMDVRVVTNPVDLNYLSRRRYESCKIIDSLFPSMSVTGSKVILSVGRLVKEKAYDVLLESLSYLDDCYQLIIAGDGPERKNLEQQIEIYGLKKRVHLVGMLTNPYPLMANCYLSIVSSRLEGFPNVLLEKMFLSPRVVSTNCADGIDEIPGIYCCGIDNPRALADSILLAEMDDENSSLERKNAMLKYINDLSVESFFKKIT
ncbi:glycosyltransferase [Aeromonas dhakensis]|uniref:glycosyltransferase n=1 Tax=Aeromonas dhakensis TaxID=196024 RepID=UPI003BA301FF